MSLDALRQSKSVGDESEIEDAEKALERYGYSEGDFTFDPPNGLSISTTGETTLSGNLTVQYKPTGVQRVYSLENITTWVAEFVQDLKTGIFKR